MKALVVEDDYTNRLLLVELLSGYGPVMVAAAGQDALTRVQAALMAHEPFDLICLDILLPGMDGQAVLREVRDLETRHGLEKGQGAKVIMATCVDDQGSIATAYANLCDGYLVKPIRRDRLIAELRRLALIG